jgi:DNA-binding NarL/FixJ family response regulator
VKGSAADGVTLFECRVEGARILVLSVAPGTDTLRKLTAAEQNVALLAAEGLSNQAIATRRGSTVRTVAKQLASVFEKLSIRSRIELAARLAEDGVA